MRTHYLALLLTALGCLFGCSESESTAGSKKVIGISIMTSENPFFVQLANAVKEEAAKHGFRVEIVSGDKKAETQEQHVQDFIAKKVNAILLTPCNAQLVGAAIKNAGF